MRQIFDKSESLAPHSPSKGGQSDLSKANEERVPVEGSSP